MMSIIISIPSSRINIAKGIYFYIFAKCFKREKKYKTRNINKKKGNCTKALESVSGYCNKYIHIYIYMCKYI